MGLILNVYKWGLGDCTNGGASATVGNICAVNIPGPFHPSDSTPAFVLARGPSGDPVLKPAAGGKGIGPMFGGNFAHTSDSRLGEAVQEMTGRPSWGALPIFDRYESSGLRESIQTIGGVVKMKTSELRGAALDWAVAKCEGAYAPSVDTDIDGTKRVNYGGMYPEWSTDWSQGGPIIEREGIALLPPGLAEMPGVEGRAETLLIAAMRCYVASHLGDEIEIPDQLIEV